MEHSKFRQRQQHKLDFYQSTKDIPIHNDKRRCTDILCIIVGLALTITLAVFACVTWNKTNYLKQVFPADTDGSTCGYQLPGYNYLYFAQSTELKNRVCVKRCPTTGEPALSCKPNSAVKCQFVPGSVEFYETEKVQNQYGMFCLPKNEDSRKTIMEKMKSYKRDLYYNSVNTAAKSLIAMAVASLIYMFFVQCCPRIMNRTAVVLGTLALIGFVVTVLVYSSLVQQLYPVLKWLVFAIVVVFVLIMVCVLAKYCSTWGLYGIFLDEATKFAWQRLYVFVLPIVFLGLGVAFYFFQILQYRSFWSFGQLQFDPENDIYHHIKNPTNNLILTIFQVIQIIWGTMFLKEAFNYLISAQATQWFNGKGSACGNGIFTLVCKHLGSVIACAFMNAFFSIGDFIFDSLIPHMQDTNSCFFCLNRFAGVFDLARSDALTIVYLSGNAYCNSARYAEYLSIKSKHASFSQSMSRIYRFTAHFLIACLITVIAMWVFGFHLKEYVAVPGMLMLLLISMGVATFFVSLHSDAADSILILYLMEQEFGERRRTHQHTNRFNEIDNEVNRFYGSHPSPDRSSTR